MSVKIGLPVLAHEIKFTLILMKTDPIQKKKELEISHAKDIFLNIKLKQFTKIYCMQIYFYSTLYGESISFSLCVCQFMFSFFSVR